MFKSLLLTISLTITICPAAFSQNANPDTGQFTAGGGDAGTQNTPTWGDYNGPSAQTGNQASTQRLFAPEIPHVSSQAATGMPIPGTYIAPANLALQTQYGMFGNPVLPVTNLDSFVAQSGYNDLIYGDEGVDDIPPYFTFDESHRIERGINQAGLTTGHASDTPEAWGWPF